MRNSCFQEAMTQFSGGLPTIFTIVPFRSPMTEYVLGMCEAVYLIKNTLKE